MLSSSPSSLISRKEDALLVVEALETAFLFGFLAAGVLKLGSSVEIGAEDLFTSAGVFSASKFLDAFFGAGFAAVIFLVGGLSPGLIVG